jgi:chromosomal replication initiation ATPase DnaA
MKTLSELDSDLTILKGQVQAFESELETRRALSAPASVIIKIQRTVAAFYGVHFDSMHIHTRTIHIAWARQVAMSFCRTLTQSSLVEIGLMFKRDHGTVIHSIKHVANIIATDRVRAGEVEQLKGILEKELA